MNFNFFFTSFKAIQKGNLDGARIHAENAIRQKYQVSRLTSDGVPSSNMCTLVLLVL